MIKITLPDGSIKEFAQNSTAIDVAKSISEGLARNVISATFNDTTVETTTPLISDGSLVLHTFNDEGGKNLYEAELLESQLKRLGLSHLKHEYIKITNLKSGQKLAETFRSKASNDLTVVVYNFVDMLSHAKTEMEVLKELAANDKGYRSLTKSWFDNSPLLEIIKQAKELNFKLIITTDHGTINVKNPSKVVGNKDTSLNLRYKTGKSLSYEQKDVLAVKDPKSIYLPSSAMNSSFIFAKDNLFFAYPNNYNHYVNYFRNTYQHGGISLEEVIIPFAILNPR